MNAQLIGNLSSQQLRRALEIKEKIEALEAQLGSMLGTSAPAAAKPAQAAKKVGGRRPMSPEARARIVAAQKLRWAKIRAQKKDKGAAKPAAKPAKAPTRKVSAAARARLAELAKARWAKVKAAGKSRL